MGESMGSQIRIVDEHNRFKISPESFKYMKTLREGLSKVREQYPEFKAMTFFGSRVVGREKTGISDIDAIIFVDGDEFKNRIIKKCDGNKFTPQMAPLVDEEDKKVKKILMDVWYNAFSGEETFHVHPADTSTNIIHAAADLLRSANISKIEKMPKWFFNVAGPFFLGTGDVRMVRERVLSEIERLPDPETHYRKLISLIEKIERLGNPEKKYDEQLSLYAHFPKTIAEAKKYFLETDKMI